MNEKQLKNKGNGLKREIKELIETKDELFSHTKRLVAKTKDNLEFNSKIQELNRKEQITNFYSQSKYFIDFRSKRRNSPYMEPTNSN